ncbi:MAG: glycosyltransferase family 9 protein [Bacteroidales bacterium]
MFVQKDCKYYLAYKPCVFHKKDGRLCEGCRDFDPIGIRILIIKLDALGDVLRTTSLLPALKAKYPVSEITWVTKKNAFDLLEGNQYINRKLAIEENFIQYLLTESFDIGICLDADPQSASILSLANTKQQFGFIINETGKVSIANQEASAWWHMGINDKLKKENRETYQSHIYKICGLKSDILKPQILISEKEKLKALQFAKDNELDKFSKVIGINTGGGGRWELKKWIFENYISLIKLIKEKNPDIGILLFGGPEEIEINRKISQELKDSIIDTGCNNSIKEFAALIGHCNLFFTSDSLGMHLSIAQNITTMVLVGPTSPWELEVFGNGEVIYNENLECIACYKSTCDFKINCMNSLEPEFIYKKLTKYF